MALEVDTSTVSMERLACKIEALAIYHRVTEPNYAAQAVRILAAERDALRAEVERLKNNQAKDKGE